MNNHLSLTNAACYSVQVQGILDRSWAEQFGDMHVNITSLDRATRPPVTTIVGEVVDQAALVGLLNLVYSLGMPLLSVTYLGRP